MSSVPQDRRGSRAIVYEQAMKAGQELFLGSGRLDMDELAETLAVSRATLYRVVGSRDRLLGGILATLAGDTLRWAEDRATSTGVDRIIEIAEAFKKAVVDFEPFRTFLRTDPDTAFRVLFTPVGGVHERTVREWSRILGDAATSGELEMPLPANDLAYVFVRIGESMLYADMLIGRPPDIGLASYLQRLLFKA